MNTANTSKDPYSLKRVSSSLELKLGPLFGIGHSRDWRWNSRVIDMRVGHKKK